MAKEKENNAHEDRLTETMQPEDQREKRMSKMKRSSGKCEILLNLK